uniref:Odorant binding protein n=1 Tax=Glyphodes pyloalis TaxID=1242752 RepID=A0A6M3GRQ9_GLYPY|nr:odorant binding protein [Glyphodes pyloalis]
MTEEELKAEFTKHVMKCLKTNPVEMAELTNLQKLIVPQRNDVKCLLACAYKSEGLMTQDGLYNLEHAYKVAELTKNGDEKRLENGKKMSDLCSEVNKQKVSDGEKGCERAGLMFKCGVENAPKFGFKL